MDSHQHAAHQAGRHTLIKAVIWLYFWLLLWEGVLRKWVLPGMSDAIFIIRDPVAILAYFLALREGVFPWRPAIAVVFLMTALSLVFSLANQNEFLVALFGVRTYFLHLPLIFLMGRVMDRKDVIRFGKWFLICSVPILLLMYRQFNSPKDSFINAGTGGSVDGQLGAAGGRIRPPGPFSFISGPVMYFSLVASFVYYGWLQPGVYNRILLITATLITIVAVPMSLSRSLLFAELTVTAFGLAVTLKDPKRISRFLGPAIAVGGFLLFFADSVYVQTFEDRWDTSFSQGGNTGFYDGTVGRYSEMFMEPFNYAAQAPMLGYGIGLGTIGGGHLSTGHYDFLLAESELARCILELGPLLGFLFIGWRLWLTVKLVAEGWMTFLRKKDTLAWLIAGATFLNVLIGQWGPATQLGFAVFGAGLVLAAVNDPGGAIAGDVEAGERLKVLLIADYPADGMESMRRFAESLSSCLQNQEVSRGRVRERVEVRTLAPPVRWGRLLGPYRYGGLPKWLGYIDKYLVFPRQLARAAAGMDLVHIVDHGSATYVPHSRKIPWLVTCHDLLTVRAMLGHNTMIAPTWTGRWQQRAILSGLRRADHVVCDSEATRGDWMRISPGMSPARSSVIPIALNHDFRQIGPEKAWRRIEAAGFGWLAGLPFVLHVGSNQPRKNRSGVVRAVAALARSGCEVRLVFAGQASDAALGDLIASLGIADHVTTVAKPDNDLLEALYNTAHALLFPSYFEGFGWPVAEAQACGCPVVCSDATSVPEVAGGAAFLHDPDDVSGMAESLGKIFDSETRSRLVREGLKNVRRFEPAEMARAYAACYARVLEGVST